MVIKRKIQQTEMIKIENFQVKDGKNRKYGRQNGNNKKLQKTKIVKFEEEKIIQPRKCYATKLQNTNEENQS